MKKKRTSFASAAVLFTVVFICITVFALLSVMTAAAEYKVAQRYRDHVTDIYACETKGQEIAAEIISLTADGKIPYDDALPDGCEINGDKITVRALENGIECILQINITEHGAKIVETRTNTQWQENDSLNLWN